MAVRPLHELLAGLAGESADPARVLAEGGHAGLPDDLVAEAIVSYVDAAPLEVAEHLAPFVTAHSVVPAGDPGATLDIGDGLRLLATAPSAGPPEAGDDPLQVGGDPGAGLDGLPAGAGAESAGSGVPAGPPQPEAGDPLAFGAGGDQPAGAPAPVDPVPAGSSPVDLPAELANPVSDLDPADLFAEPVPGDPTDPAGITGPEPPEPPESSVDDFGAG